MSFTRSFSIGLNVPASQNGLAGAITGNLTETSTGTKYEFTPVGVTTSWVAIPLGSLGSFDIIAAQNTDQTNYVQVALDNAGAKIFCRLPPGTGNNPGRPMLLMPEPGATLYWKATGGTCVCNLGGVEP